MGVNKLEGHTCYCASAGSGKTTTIVNTVRDAIACGVDVSRLLILTFENGAKDHMKKKIDELDIGRNKPTISTVHALSYSIIKRSLGNDFKILSEDWERIKIVKKLIKKISKTNKKFEIKQSSAISFLEKHDRFNISARDKSIFALSNDEIKLFYSYQDYKAENRLLGFSDLLYTCYELLSIDEVLNMYSSLYKYIIVDEFQDIGKCAYEIIKLLAKANGNLMVCGDFKQAIYSFAGASPKYIKEFKSSYPDANILTLNKTYRTPYGIIDKVNVIANDLKDISVTSESKCKGNINVLHFDDEDSQSEAIINKIVKDKLPIDDCAVIFRLNSAATWFQYRCIKKDIPFFSKKITPIEHYATTSLLYLCAYVLDGCTDEELFTDAVLSSSNILNKGDYINPKKELKAELVKIKNKGNDAPLNCYNTCLKLMEDKKEFPDIFLKLSSFSSTNGIMKDAYYPLYEIAKQCKTLGEFNKIRKKIKKNRNDKNGLRLMTIHSVKGMEFDNVFLINCNMKTMPHDRALKEDPLNAPAEELRLFYVAVTRTIKNLYISYCDIIGGKFKLPSEYLYNYFKKETLECNENIQPEQCEIVLPNSAD